MCFLAPALSMFLIGCAREPYVKADCEFNRRTETYINVIRSRNTVEVCYNTLNANPKKVSNLALVECGRFGKRVRLSKTSYTICPLRTPIAIVYDCDVPEKVAVEPMEKLVRKSKTLERGREG